MWTQGQGGGSLSGSPGHPQILLEDTGQCTPPKSAWSHCPPPRPQAWPLLPSTELPGRKLNPELRLDLCLALGPFQGTGKILKMKRSLEEQLTQSLRSLGTVRRSWSTQLSLPRALPSLLGLTASPPCCSQPLSRPTSCSPSRPTLLPTVSCWRCKCLLPSCSLVSLWYAK